MQLRKKFKTNFIITKMYIWKIWIQINILGFGTILWICRNTELVCTWRRPHRGWGWRCRGSRPLTRSGGSLQPSGPGWSRRWSPRCRLPTVQRAARSEGRREMLHLIRNFVHACSISFYSCFISSSNVVEYRVKRSKVSTHRVDDRGGARLLNRFTTGVWVQTAGVSAAAPHTAVLVVGRVAAAAVGASDRAVVQSHWRRSRISSMSSVFSLEKILSEG